MSSTPRRLSRCAEEYMHNINISTYSLHMSSNKLTPGGFVVGRPNTKPEPPIALPEGVEKPKIVVDPILPRIVVDPILPQELPGAPPSPTPKAHESHPPLPALSLPMQVIRKATGEEDLLMASKDHGKPSALREEIVEALIDPFPRSKLEHLKKWMKERRRALPA